MDPENTEVIRTTFRQRVEAELLGNILPFWIRHAVDRVNGGFYGALTNDLQALNDVPRSAVVCARILWTYAAAYRRYRDPEHLDMARWAYAALTGPFWDRQHGGVYWQIDARGHPVMDRKHSYAQAFAIYGLSEYYRATQETESLRRAQELFELLEAHAHDPLHGGYVEGRSRDWGALADMRLSEKEPDCQKSMNTMLHVLEAYSNLLRVWEDGKLRSRLRELLEIFFEHILDPETHHFKLFFDQRWSSLGGPNGDRASYGHDIEGSWLLVEAADILGDPRLLAQAREAAVGMASAVLAEGLGEDGSVLYEGGPQGILNAEKHWWPQAEGMVGFYNAYQVSGRLEFARAARRVWDVIEARFVDRRHGEWFKVLDPQGLPYPDQYKSGPWECPYHQSRACYEMIERLKE